MLKRLMKGNNQIVLLDSCFWIALYLDEEEGGRGQKARDLAEVLYDYNAKFCVPWPTMYEFVNSKLGRRDTLDQFKKVIYSANVERLPDTLYREHAIQNVLDRVNDVYGDISLVDEIIRSIILDPNVNINFLASFDEALCNFALAHRVQLAFDLV